MIHIQRDNIDELYSETLQKLRAEHIEEETRGGPVLSFPSPILWGLTNPRNRVLINPVRDANPFFHVMEFVWMMSGEPKIEWITQFSKGYGNFAADGAGYGYRWRNHFNRDQIVLVIEILKNDPNTRRAVLQMWDCENDLTYFPRKEVPCNHSITFRNIGGKLEMTVLNRSNDIIWGALGANVVHMTMLHELIAFGAGLQLGTYRAFSTNAHMYTQMPRFKELYNDWSQHFVEQCRPILREGERWEDFLEDCENMVKYPNFEIYSTEWMNQVANRIKSRFLRRDLADEYPQSIECPGWSRACENWLDRRKK